MAEQTICAKTTLNRRGRNRQCRHLHPGPGQVIGYFVRTHPGEVRLLSCFRVFGRARLEYSRAPRVLRPGEPTSCWRASTGRWLKVADWDGDSHTPASRCDGRDEGSHPPQESPVADTKAEAVTVVDWRTRLWRLDVQSTMINASAMGRDDLDTIADQLRDCRTKCAAVYLVQQEVVSVDAPQQALQLQGSIGNQVKVRTAELSQAERATAGRTRGAQARRRELVFTAYTIRDDLPNRVCL